MQLQLLHLDDALTHQQSFLSACRDAGGREHDLRNPARSLRLWGRARDVNTFKSQLPHGREPQLTFMGSGDFHHVTALLLERLAQASSERFTVVHFDNHPDWVHFSGGMHCGSWAGKALDIPGVQKVVTIGVCSKDLIWPEFKRANLRVLREGRLELFPYSHAPSKVFGKYGSGPSYTQEGGALHWHTMELHGDDVFLEYLLSRIDTDAIYITVDKDVLAEGEVTTNWDQGKMRLPQLLGMIAALGEKFRIIGADVTGDYSTPEYGGGAWPVLKKRVESRIDQPRRGCTPQSVAHGNAESNLALLRAFSEVMA